MFAAQAVTPRVVDNKLVLTRREPDQVLVGGEWRRKEGPAGHHRGVTDFLDLPRGFIRIVVGYHSNFHE